MRNFYSLKLALHCSIKIGSRIQVYWLIQVYAAFGGLLTLGARRHKTGLLIYATYAGARWSL